MGACPAVLQLLTGTRGGRRWGAGTSPTALQLLPGTGSGAAGVGRFHHLGASVRDRLGGQWGQEEASPILWLLPGMGLGATGVEIPPSRSCCRGVGLGLGASPSPPTWWPEPLGMGPVANPPLLLIQCLAYWSLLPP